MAGYGKGDAVILHYFLPSAPWPHSRMSCRRGSTDVPTSLRAAQPQSAGHLRRPKQPPTRRPEARARPTGFGGIRTVVVPVARRSVEENSVRIVIATHPAHLLEPRPARLPKGHGVLATTQSNDESRGFFHFSLRSYPIYGARIALRSLPRREGHQVAPHPARALRASCTEDQ